jgi:hypothetical protein
MRAEKSAPIRVLFIIVSIFLFISTIGKLAVTLMGAYGEAIFVTFDTISSAFLLIWIITLILYVSPIQEQKDHDI